MPPNDSPGSDHRSGSAQGVRRGSHRGPARGPQLLKAGGLLLSVAALLAAVGFAITWTTDTTSDDPGKFKAAKIKDLCDAIDTESVKKLEVAEEGRESDSDKSKEPARFTCQLRFTNPTDSPDYQAITLNVDARVAATIGGAQDTFAGAVEYEKSRGFKVTKKKTGDEAAAIPKVNTKPQECRTHVRSSNVVVSAEMTVSGPKLSCDGNGIALLLETGTSALGKM